MPGYIEDRWLTKRPSKVTGERELTALGKKKSGKRYKVAGIPGVRARSFEMLSDAKTWLATAQTDQRRGEFVDPRDGSITLADYIDQKWLPAVTGAPNTTRNAGTHTMHLKRELGAQQLAVLARDPSHIRIALKRLTDRPLAAGYVRRIKSTLSSILETAVDDHRIPRNPARLRSVVIPTVPQEKREAWRETRVLAVRDAISPRYRLMVVLGVGCGLRKGEVLGLAEDDIDYKAGIVHVRRQLQCDGTKRYFRLPKGSKTRTVVMPPSVAAEARAHIAKFPSKLIQLPWEKPGAAKTQAHRLIFTSTRGNAVRMSNWDQLFWKTALVKAGVLPPLAEGAKWWDHEAAPKDGFHVLRHTFASLQLQAGESVVTLAAWLGHSTPTITLDHYAHFVPQAGDKGRAAVDALLGEPIPIGSPHKLPRRIRSRAGKTKMQVKRQ